MPLAQIDDGTQQMINTVFNAPLEVILAAALLFLGLAVFAQIIIQGRIAQALNRKIEADAVQTSAIRDLADEIKTTARSSNRAADETIATHAAITEVTNRMNKGEEIQQRILKALGILYHKTDALEKRVTQLAEAQDPAALKPEFDSMKAELRSIAQMIQGKNEDPK